MASGLCWQVREMFSNYETLMRLISCVSTPQNPSLGSVCKMCILDLLLLNDGQDMAQQPRNWNQYMCDTSIPNACMLSSKAVRVVNHQPPDIGWHDIQDVG